MPTYKITDTREIRAMTPAGTSTLRYRVWLMTEHGAMGTVDVEQRDWNKEALSDILEQRAEELDLAFSFTE